MIATEPRDIGSRRLFQDAYDVPALVLQDVRRFGSTVILTTYRIAG
jgi:hypothetical protein